MPGISRSNKVALLSPPMESGHQSWPCRCKASIDLGRETPCFHTISSIFTSPTPHCHSIFPLTQTFIFYSLFPFLLSWLLISIVLFFSTFFLFLKIYSSTYHQQIYLGGKKQKHSASGAAPQHWTPATLVAEELQKFLQSPLQGLPSQAPCTVGMSQAQAKIQAHFPICPCHDTNIWWTADESHVSAMSKMSKLLGSLPQRKTAFS